MAKILYAIGAVGVIVLILTGNVPGYLTSSALQVGVLALCFVYLALAAWDVVKWKRGASDRSARRAQLAARPATAKR